MAASALYLYPTPDAVYQVDVPCAYHAPRISVAHLSGRANTVDLPIPEQHLVTMVVPLCAQHFTAHPLRKPPASFPDPAAQASLGAAAVAALPAGRTATRRPYGTPTGF